MRISLGRIVLVFFVALAAHSSVEAQTKPAPKTISGGILNGKAISLPKPVYPADAAKSRIGGSVKVRVVIDESGKVVSAETLSGIEFPSLRAAAETAARRATFTPTTLSGRPAKVSGVIIYNFVAESNEERLKYLGVSTFLSIARHFAPDLTHFNDNMGEKGDLWRDGAEEYPEFAAEFNALQGLESLPVNRRVESIDAAIASLKSKAKGPDAWQTEVGVNLGDSLGALMWAVTSAGDAKPDSMAIDEQGLKLSLNKLKQLLLSVPQDFPQDVLQKLESLVSLTRVADLTSDENLPSLLAAIQELLETIAPESDR